VIGIATILSRCLVVTIVVQGVIYVIHRSSRRHLEYKATVTFLPGLASALPRTPLPRALPLNTNDYLPGTYLLKSISTHTPDETLGTRFFSSGRRKSTQSRPRILIFARI
jgi:hypothetical protein